MKEVYKSRVYTDRPAYADYDAPEKFNAMVYLNHSGEVKVIGNIHDNPEILEGGGDNA